jgi:hypothetical protein
MKTIADAISRIQKTLNTPKLKSALARMDATLARADADFSEDDHPRGPDGKFAAKGGISGAAKHGVEAYKKTLKAGAAMKPQGLIKSMIKSGQYSEKDIWEAAKDTFDLTDDKKKWVKHSYYKLKHESGDKNFPPLPKESTVGVEPEPAAAPEPAPPPPPPVPPPPPPPVAPPPTPPAPAPTAAAAALGWFPDTMSDQEKKKLIQNVPFNINTKFKTILDHYENLTDENKPKIYEKFTEISKAAEKTGDDYENAVFALADIKGYGMSVSATNSAIQQWKSDIQATMAKTPASYTPTTASQQAAFSKLSAAPHKRKNNVEYYENSEGQEVECVLKTDTKNIPGDSYAKVSSAYGGEVTHAKADSYAVDSAMEDYHYSTYSKFSTAEVTALSIYQGSGHRDINAALRSGQTSDPSINKSIKSITSAINKGFVPADTPVYRGIKATLEEISGFSDPKMAVGRVFEHKSFVSCSRAESVSANFSKGDTEASTLLKFVVPAGTNGVVMSGQKTYEKEIVLQKNSTFLIEKVEMTPTGRPIVHVKYMGITK